MWESSSCSPQLDQSHRFKAHFFKILVLVGAIGPKLLILPWCWWWAGWHWSVTLNRGSMSRFGGNRGGGCGLGLAWIYQALAEGALWPWTGTKGRLWHIRWSRGSQFGTQGVGRGAAPLSLPPQVQLGPSLPTVVSDSTCVCGKLAQGRWKTLTSRARLQHSGPRAGEHLEPSR